MESKKKDLITLDDALLQFKTMFPHIEKDLL